MDKLKAILEPYRQLAYNRWQQFNSREQRLLSALAIVLAIAFLYFIIWLPSSQSVIQAENRLKSQQDQYQWVQQAIARYKSMEGRSAKSSTVKGSLSQRINQAAAQYDIELARIQPQGEEYLVTVDTVPFNQLLQFMNALESDFGLQLTGADIARLEQPGSVRLRKLLVKDVL